ncbi:MAG: WecB/TagA/CpsF family glycosyltransferase [Planctomycetia bacterium]|nr:WecB/TagA/CpsF family glycosyltransferase [Planctomycetia bacterium]
MPSTVELFGMHIDPLRMPEAVAQVWNWIEEGSGTCRYVVTPNVDHAVMLRDDVRLQAAYKHASLVLADGFPVVLASRLLKRPLPERVAGSDLAPALFASATVERPMSIYLLGAAPGVADRAAVNIAKRWPNAVVVGTYSPPLGFQNDTLENERIVARINAAAPDVLVLGFGAPKQEHWIAAHYDRLNAKTALCIGATIDFLAGEQSRAPLWMQKLNLEWLHRLAGQPRRLFKRYARDAVVFPQLVWKEWRNGPKG